MRFALLAACAIASGSAFLTRHGMAFRVGPARASSFIGADPSGGAVRVGPVQASSFNGAYPSGGADAFETALACLTPEGSDGDRCTIEVMESAFRVLDSEMVRAECTPEHNEKIDELWRVIKMMYGGATRLEALAARSPSKIRAPQSDEYAKALRFLNPQTRDVDCSLADLESTLQILEIMAGECNRGQIQVIEQLRKAIARVKEGESVPNAIQTTWGDRDHAARARLGEKQL